MRKNFFCLIAAIAVLLGFTSCNKDVFQKTPMNFFAFKDAKTVTLYDEGLVEVGEKSIEVGLQLMYPISFPYSGEEFAPMQEETLERRIRVSDLYDEEIGTDYRSAKDAIITEFNFNYYPNCYTVRITGLNINDADNFYICMETLKLSCTYKTIELKENPFRQKVQLDFVLQTEKSGIVLAEGSQFVYIDEVILPDIDMLN